MGDFDANDACFCLKGDAGRHGVVGEKGPNGLPVSTKAASIRLLRPKK